MGKKNGKWIIPFKKFGCLYTLILSRLQKCKLPMFKKAIFFFFASVEMELAVTFVHFKFLSDLDLTLFLL